MTQEIRTMIKEDIEMTLADGFSITNLMDDLKDAPEDYEYSTDDLETYLFEQKINNNENL
jgi:hypothetical protein